MELSLFCTIRDVVSVETSRSRDALTSRLGLGPMRLGSRAIASRPDVLCRRAVHTVAADRTSMTFVV